MSVRADGQTIVLAGRCRVDDAETLLLALQDRPGACVDITGVETLHLAVLQVLLALKPAVSDDSATGFRSRKKCGRLISFSDSLPASA